MRQRNVLGYPLSIPELGVTVHPGEEINPDGEELLAGFEPVTDPEPEPAPLKTRKSSSTSDKGATA